MALLIKMFPVFVYLSKSSVSLGCFDFYFCAQEGGEKRALLSKSFSETPDDGQSNTESPVNTEVTKRYELTHNCVNTGRSPLVYFSLPVFHRFLFTLHYFFKTQTLFSTSQRGAKAHTFLHQNAGIYTHTQAVLPQLQQQHFPSIAYGCTKLSCAVQDRSKSKTPSHSCLQPFPGGS